MLVKQIIQPKPCCYQMVYLKGWFNLRFSNYDFQITMIPNTSIWDRCQQLKLKNRHHYSTPLPQDKVLQDLLQQLGVLEVKDSWQGCWPVVMGWGWNMQLPGIGFHRPNATYSKNTLYMGGQTWDQL